MKPVTRIAPSPTGPLHIGTARTALFNWLFTKQKGGRFILRVEDTDKERSDKKFEEDILEGLNWLNLEWDETYHQSERFDIYLSQAQKLIEDGRAYEEDGAIILKKSKKDISFNDLVRGEVVFKSADLKDLVIIKSDKSPTYNFAVAIDDDDMEINYVIRGEDHISNTPKQIMVQEALEIKRPTYAHLPLILGNDKSKLSKRHGATSVNRYRRRGYLPDAFVNFMALLGWNPGDDREIFSREELLKEFNISKIQKGGAVFNKDKLDWFNQKYIQKMSLDRLKEELENFGLKNISKEFVETLQPRIKTLREAEEDMRWYKEPEYDAKLLIWKKSSEKETRKNLEKVLDIIKEKGVSKDEVMEFADKTGRGEVLWPLRVALSGEDKSPSPFELMAILEKEESVKRIEKAIKKIESIK